MQNGSQNADRLSGATGNDYLLGHGGNDRLYGNAGDDVLDGGEGDDWVSGRGGRDVLTGGTGEDIFFLNIHDRPKNTLREADIATDFGLDDEADKIYLGRNINMVWIKRQDVDGNGRQDTVLYDNPAGQGGIHVVLLDFSGPLEGNDFHLATPTIVEIP